MKDEIERNLRFFAEWVHYKEDSSEDRLAAENYLKLWKKFLLRKLKNELHNYEPYDGQIVDGDKMKSDPDEWYEHWVDRPAMLYGPLSTDATLALRFCMKRKLPYEIG